MSNDDRSLEDVQTKIDRTLSDIENSIPQDDVERLTGIKAGTEEHAETTKLLDSLKEVNSTKRVNSKIYLIKLMGWVGLALSVVVKLWAMNYDLNYHLPNLHLLIGELGLAFLGFFIVMIVLLMTHVLSDGIVNNKWRKIPRFALTIGAMVGLMASIFIDYRAIDNYTKTMMDNKKTEVLGNNTDIAGVAMKTEDVKGSIIQKNIELAQTSLVQNMKALQSLNEQKEKVNNSIELAKAKKAGGNISNKQVRILNQNIYTSRKQLTAIDEDIARLEIKNESIKKTLEEEQNKLDSVTITKQEIIKDTDERMSDEQIIRLTLLFVLLLIIEASSFGSLWADWLVNKNSNDGLYDEMDKINNISNGYAVMKDFLRLHGVRQAKNINDELRMRGALADVANISAISSMQNQVDNIKTLTVATSEIGRTTNELVNKSVEGIANGLKANLYKQEAQILLETLQEFKDGRK